MKKKTKKSLDCRHVPNGKEPCQVCCLLSSGIYITPNIPGRLYTEDDHVGLDTSKFRVCEYCGGTGVDLKLSEEERMKLKNLRYARRCHEYDLQKLISQIEFGEKISQDPPVPALYPIMRKLLEEAVRITYILEREYTPEDVELFKLAFHYWQMAGCPEGVYAEKMIRKHGEIIFLV